MKTAAATVFITAVAAPGALYVGSLASWQVGIWLGGAGLGAAGGWVFGWGNTLNSALAQYSTWLWTGAGAANTRYKLGSGPGLNNWVDTVEDHLSKLGKAMFDPKSPFYYGVPNSNGGEVWVSTDLVGPLSHESLVEGYPGNVTVLSGVHGNIDGGFTPKEAFYYQDFYEWEDLPNVKVFNVTELTPNDLVNRINAQGRVICAWCLSERSRDVIQALLHP